MSRDKILLLALFIHPLVAKATCFYPQGVEAPDFPCKPSEENSTCCGENYVCYSNGLCRPGPNAVNHGLTDFYRGSCTDPTWTSPECPLFCLSGTVL